MAVKIQGYPNIGLSNINQPDPQKIISHYFESPPYLLWNTLTFTLTLNAVAVLVFDSVVVGGVFYTQKYKCVNEYTCMLGGASSKKQ